MQHRVGLYDRGEDVVGLMDSYGPTPVAGLALTSQEIEASGGNTNTVPEAVIGEIAQVLTPEQLKGILAQVII